MNIRQRKKRYLPIFLVMCMIITTLVPGSIAYADVDLGGGGTMTVKGTDDNGAYNAESGTAAKMSYSGNASKQYTFSIQLSGLSGSGNKISVELADGMKFAAVEANAPNFSNTVTSAGITTENFSAITSMRNLDPYGNISYNRGVKKASAELKSGISATNWRFTVALDERLIYENIDQAIKVTFGEGGNAKTVAIPVSATIPTHVATISERTKTVKNGGACSFTLADDGAGGLFSTINDSIPYTGNYSITYTCPNGIIMKLKDSASGKFDLTKSGNTYTLTSLNPVGGTITSDYLEEPVVYSVTAPEGTKSLTVTATKSFITLDGKTTLSTTSPRKFVIIPDDEAVYVQYTSNASYLNSTDKAGTLNKQIKSSNENFCDVGNIHVGNAGASDSNDKTCEILFDKDKVLVTAVPLNLSVGNKITSVEVKTTKKDTYTNIDISKTGTLDRNNWVSTTELGLDEDEYITALRYDMGVIPANSKVILDDGRHFALGLCLFDVADGAQTIGTIEVYDTADKTVTTGKGKINATVSNDTDIAFSGMGSTQTKTCGDTAKISNITIDSYYDNQLSDLNYYIVVPDAATLSDLKIIYGGGSVDVSKYLKVTGPLTATDGSRYYKVDTSDIPKSMNSVGRHFVDPDTGVLSIGSASILYNLNTNKLDTPDGTYKLNDMIYVEAVNVSKNPLDSNNQRIGITGNPVGFDGVVGSLFTMNTTNTLTLNKAKDIIATSESKHSTDTEWSKYDGTENSYLGVGFNSTFQIKTHIENTAGTDAPAGTAVWQPIPKAGEDWGDLSAAKDADGNDLDKIPFNIQLKTAITNPDPTIYKITYGTGVTPPTGSNYNNWDVGNGTWYTEAQITANPDLLKDVNCVKITNIAPIADGDKADFIADVTVPKGFEDKEEFVDIFKPLIFRDFSTDDGDKIQGYALGDAVAIQMCLGNIEGKLFKDVNKNGIMDAGDSLIDGTADGGWTVSAYRTGNTAKTLRTAKVAADGSYSLVDITRQEGQIDLIATNQLTGENYYFTKVVKGLTGNYFTDSSDHKTGTATGVTSVIKPGTAEDRDSGKSYTGIYDAGITNTKTKLTFRTATGDAAKGTFTFDGTANLTTKESSDYGYNSVPAVSVQHKAGYSFVGWSTKSNANINTASDFTTLPTKYGYDDTTYYAYFKTVDYKIDYVMNNGTNSSANPAKYNVETSTITLQDPTRTGYDFAGWTTKDVTTPTKALTIPKGSTGDKEFTANWVAKDYNINYVMNSGTNHADNPAKYNIETNTITLKDPTRAGYTFTGWTTKDVTTPTKALTVPKGSTGDKEFTANWSATDYKINYVMNNGTNHADNPAKYNIETNTITLKDPTRSGYTFTGWTTKDVTTPTKALTIPKGSTGDKEFTANWVKTSDIIFDTAGGTPAKIDSIKANTGDNIKDKVKGVADPTKDNYKFAGWTNSETGKLLSANDKMPGNDVTLTANWNKSTGKDDGDAEISIAAIDFTVAKDKVKDLTDKKVIDLAEAKAWVTDDPATTVAISKTDYSKIKAENGDYPVTFTATKDGKTKTTTVTAYVRDNQDPGDEKATIAGNDITYPVIDKNGNPNPELSPADILKMGKVISTNKAGFVTDGSDVTVDKDQLAAINKEIKAGKAGGPYDLKLTNKGGAEATIKVTLTKTGTIIDGKGQITSKDQIYYSIKDGAIKEDAVKTLCGVVAKDKDGNVLDLSKVTVDKDQLAAINKAIADKEKKSLPVTFTDPEGNTTTTIVNLKDNGVNDKDKGSLHSDDVTLQLKDGQRTADKMKALCKVVLCDKYGNALDISKVTADSKQLNAVNDAILAGDTGTYDLTFTDPATGMTCVSKVTLEGEPDLKIVKTIVNPKKEYKAGDTITYSIAVTNSGAAKAIDTVVTDKPEGLSFTSYMKQKGVSFNEAAMSWTIDEIGPDKTVTIKYTMTIKKNVKKFTNMATINSVNGDPTDPSDHNNSSNGGTYEITKDGNFVRTGDDSNMLLASGIGIIALLAAGLAALLGRRRKIAK